MLLEVWSVTLSLFFSYPTDLNHTHTLTIFFKAIFLVWLTSAKLYFGMDL